MNDLLIKNRKNILFLTDIPPSKNYTGGIMISQLMRFLIEEKHNVSCFCVTNKSLKPILDKSIIGDIDFINKYKPEENFRISKLTTKEYYQKIQTLKNQLIKYIKNNNFDKIVCSVQGEVIIELLDEIRKYKKVEYIPHIWDPVEWWIKEYNFDEQRKENILKKYDRILLEAKVCITASKPMSNKYSEKYSNICIDLAPALAKINSASSVTSKEKNKFIISLAGQMYAKDATYALLKSLKSINWKISGKEIFFHYYGNWNNNEINIKEFNNIKTRIILSDFIPQNVLLEELTNSDLLYCPYFFSTNEVYKKVSKLSFPSKLITYLSVKVPTLVHAPDYSSPYKFLEEEKAAYLLRSIDEKSIIKTLKNIIISTEKQKSTIMENAKILFENNFDLTIIKKKFLKALNVHYIPSKKLKILQVNNVDLSGRRFNGYDLQKHINCNTVHSSKQIVTDKTSNDKNVIEFFEDTDSKLKHQTLLNNEFQHLSVHSNLSFTSEILKNNHDFIESDIIHYHLTHNTKLSLFKMNELFSVKPTIWTIHDPWAFTGRCVHPEECEKWKTGCYDCQNLGNLFPMNQDNCSSLWELKKNIYKNLDIDIVVTTPFMEKMLKESPLTQHFNNVHVIPFGIDLKKFNNTISRKKAKQKLGIRNDNIVLFFRAQEAFKGTEFIIEALQKLKTTKKITLLTCSEKNIISELADRYNIIDLGNIDDKEMIIAYNACDIFLMPSRGESFGLMAIEAMACARPIIIFDNTSLPYVTFAPECGVLVKNKDSDDLRRKIKWLIENENERNKRGILGRKLAEENYDIIKYHKKIMDLYKSAYERQKTKNKYILDVKKIDYSSEDVQIIIKKLKKIYSNLTNGSKITADFINYEYDQFIDINRKINYSLESVQYVIQQFNEYIYNEFLNHKQIECEPLNTKVLNLTPFINKINCYVKRTPIIYKISKPFYKILKRIKKTISNDYYKEISLRFKSHENEINNLILNHSFQCEKIENQSQKIELLEKKQEENSLEINNQKDRVNQLFLKCNEIVIENKNMLEEINQLENEIMDDVSNILYYHGGSGNHGCEALVKTIMQITKLKRETTLLLSYNSNEDIKFGIKNIIKYIKSSNLDANEIEHINFSKKSIAISIGGDNYCGFDYGTKKLEKYNNLFNEKGVVTALIGCSIEEEILEHSEVLEDLNRFSLITARESLTYKALIDKGINKNLYLIPDSAFILKKSDVSLPFGYDGKNTIGINLSDLIQSYDTKENLTYSNFYELIQYILDKTNYKIVLIPHVVQEHNDDLVTLYKLYMAFKNTNRVALLNESNCNEAKGYISKCKIFICSRTHASIAGYSSMVPTLVLGYSIKSRGIAKDLFGTHENYVLSVHSLKSETDLIKSFKWFDKNYLNIKNHLKKVIPEYIERCDKLKEVINECKKNAFPKPSLANYEDCTGCGACKEVCPENCIQMHENEEGFLYPKVNYKNCIQCNICREICPIKNKKEYLNLFDKKAYAATNNNLFSRLESSSGGVFSVFAENILGRNGTVFGAIYNNENMVVHTSIESLENLHKLRGSKYVQSNLYDTFKAVKEKLEENKLVLFSGTPCQVIGLKAYLRKDYKNLFCIDIICHGVPSPKVFRKYLNELEVDNNSLVTKVNFRDKSNGWNNYNVKIEFFNKKIILENHNKNLYMQLFLTNIALRKSCYNCHVKNLGSMSDITLGDFWGVEKQHFDFDDKGVSCIIVNSYKGDNFLNQIKEKLILIESNIEYILKANPCLIKSVKTNDKRHNFFKNLDNKSLKELV